jgi:hypothetical protein
MLRNQPVLVVAVVIAFGVIALLIAMALLIAFWGGWLVVVAFLTLVHRRGRYGARLPHLRNFSKF